jgi:hypothetical protein
MKPIVISTLIFLVCIPHPRASAAQTPRTYSSAKVDSSGRLVISTTEGRTIVVAREGEQTRFDKPVVSPDETAVGAQALFPNCCTSYDLPLQLVVCRSGKIHRLSSDRFSIFWWRFVDGGTRLSFGATTPHSGCAIHYELREIDSERLIDSVDVPESGYGGMCGAMPPLQREIPKWVEELIATRK